LARGRNRDKIAVPRRGGNEPIVKVKFKSAQELQQALKGTTSIAVFSCGGCANLSDVAGDKGLQFITQLLEKWGKQVVAARTVVSCCPETVMKRAQQAYLEPSNADALVVISCAAGVQSAFLCKPGVPVVAACDTVGIGCIPSDSASAADAVARGACSTCGHCVLSYTGGICPLAHCPAKSLYGPCKRAPTANTKCALIPQRDCIWRTIEDRGADLAALQVLKAVHEEHGQSSLPVIERNRPPDLVRKVFSYVAARLPGKFMEPIHWVR
jgi:hypothetical protein